MPREIAAAAERAVAEPVAAPVPPVTLIRPQSGWQLLNVRELWQFRDLIYFLIWRDVKVRYKQTLLGVVWAVLQPAMMMVVFTLFFANVAKWPRWKTIRYSSSPASCPGRFSPRPSRTRATALSVQSGS